MIWQRKLVQVLMSPNGLEILESINILTTSTMKRFIFLLITMMLAFSVSAFSQTIVPDPVAEYANVFTTFAALVAVIPVVVELIKKLVPAVTYRSIVTQIVSWIVGIAVTFAGWYFQLGFLHRETMLYKLNKLSHRQ